eukprot:gene51768-877_t
MPAAVDIVFDLSEFDADAVGRGDSDPFPAARAQLSRGSALEVHCAAAVHEEWAGRTV